MTEKTLFRHIERNLENARKRLYQEKDICDANKKTINEFLIFKAAEGISASQQLAYIDRLMPIARLLGSKTFKEATKQDMQTAFVSLRKKNYTPSSLNKIVSCTKAFWRYVFNVDSKDRCPEAVGWLKREKHTNKLRAEDLLTETDIHTLINASGSLKMKAMIGIVSEAGCRPGELRALKIGDVSFGQGGIIKLYFRGKTEKKMGERVGILVRSSDLLKLWFNSHPHKSNPAKWLWSLGEKPIPEDYFRRQLQFLGRKTGLNKPLTVYLLRHTALTKFYKVQPTEIARRLAGHGVNSGMAEVYCHLAESDLEESVLAMNGIHKKTEMEQNSCKKCNKILQLGSGICDFCGVIQDNKTGIEKFEYEQNLIKLAKALLKRAEENPEIVDMLLKTDLTK